MEMTLDRIGRLMKILGLTDAAILAHLAALLCAGGTLALGRSSRCIGIVVAHRTAIPGLQDAVHHYALAALEATVHKIIVANGNADLHPGTLDLVVLAVGHGERRGVEAVHVQQQRVEGGHGAAGAVTDERSAQITAGLGGAANIRDVDCCATRLRVTVHDGSKVDDALLKATGAAGVIKRGEGVQVVYGPQVNVIKTDLEAYLAALPTQAEETTADTVAASVSEESIDCEPARTIVLGSPLAGEALSITACPDEVFAGKMMGDGACIVPATGELVSPCDATVSFVFETKHAVGLALEDGTELLCHVGIDTVKLGGKGFTAHVAAGDMVKRGDKLLTFDLDLIRASAPSISTPVLVTSVDEQHKVRQLAFGRVDQGDDLLAVDVYEV